MQHRVRADLDVFVNKTVRADVSSRANSRGFCDYSGRMNVRSIPRNRVEQFDCSCEIQLWIRREQRSGATRAGIFFSHNDGGCARSCEQWTIFAISEKCQLPRLRILDARNAGDLNFRVTAKFAAQLPGDIAKFHDSFSS